MSQVADQHHPARQVRTGDLPSLAHGEAAGAIDALYAGDRDVVVLRGALPAAPLMAAGDRLDGAPDDAGWARPNLKMPVEDLRLIGTDTPATPTYAAPRGAPLADYLAAAERHAASTAGLFDAGFDIAAELPAVLSRCAAGRPVSVARAADGRPFVPFTVRRLPAGTQIGLHHDHHYDLELYRELAAQLDTRTLLSWVVTLRESESGGELVVYGATSDDPAVPRVAGGFAYDLAAVEAGYHRCSVATAPGDLFLLASGRCLHRVARVAGPRARITLGGFLALDRAGERVLFWS